MSWKQSPLWYTDCRSNICKTHGHQRYLLRLVSTLSCPVVVQSHRFNQKKKHVWKTSSTNSHLLLTICPAITTKITTPHSPTVHSTGRQGCWGPWWVGGLLSLAIQSTKVNTTPFGTTQPKTQTGWKEKGLQTSKPLSMTFGCFQKIGGKHPKNGWWK